MAKKRKRRRNLGAMETPPHPLISKSFKTPKGCHVRSIELRSKGTIKSREAHVSYDCGGGGRGSFPLPGEEHGWSNYPKAIVRGVWNVRTPGATISEGKGLAHVDFELSPRYVTCRKKAGEHTLHCSVHTGSGVLSGGRRRKRRR